jgi:uncharacterized membrane protein YkvI
VFELPSKAGEVVVVCEHHATVVTAGFEKVVIVGTFAVLILCAVYVVAIERSALTTGTGTCSSATNPNTVYLSAVSGMGDSSLSCSRSSRCSSRSLFISSIFR